MADERSGGVRRTTGTLSRGETSAVRRLLEAYNRCPLEHRAMLDQMIRGSGETAIPMAEFFAALRGASVKLDSFRAAARVARGLTPEEQRQEDQRRADAAARDAKWAGGTDTRDEG
jgi:hypothetical protein